MGCQYAAGRAEGAPQLRRELDTRNQGILACEAVYAIESPVEHEGKLYPGAWHDGQYVADAYLQPEGMLPHCLGGDLDLMFPRAVAGEELKEVEEAVDPLEQRGEKLGRENTSRATVGRKAIAK